MKKFEVAEQYDFQKARTPKTLIEQILRGWRGYSWTDSFLGNQTHRVVDAELCKKHITHAEKELLAWIHLERNTPQLALRDDLSNLVRKEDSLKGKSLLFLSD